MRKKSRKNFMEKPLLERSSDWHLGVRNKLLTKIDADRKGRIQPNAFKVTTYEISRFKSYSQTFAQFSHLADEKPVTIPTCICISGLALTKRIVQPLDHHVRRLDESRRRITLLQLQLPNRVRSNDRRHMRIPNRTAQPRQAAPRSGCSPPCPQAGFFRSPADIAGATPPQASSCPSRKNGFSAASDKRWCPPGSAPSSASRSVSTA